MATKGKGIKGKGITKKIELKPIVKMRVVCEDCLKAGGGRVPWLRRLFVIWAAPPPEVKKSDNPSQDGGGPAKGAAEPSSEPDAGTPTTPAVPPNPVYTLHQSNKDGYLCPLGAADPKPDETMGMFPDHTYWFYLVRHPDDSLPKDVSAELNENQEKAVAKWGKPIEIAPEFISAGKSKDGRPIKEGLIKIPEKSSQFIPKGSELYDEWVLFRDMPGTGVSSKNGYRQCPEITKQVRKLQYHLGELRYPVGNQWHPYSPQPWSLLKPSQGVYQVLFPNDGWFEVATWNAVLAFQKDANSAKAMVLPRGNGRSQILVGENFDAPAEPDWDREIAESALYRSTEEANENTCYGGISPKFYTIVDLETGNTIRTWLTMKLRKPGTILVSYGDVSSWIHEDAYPKMMELDRCLGELGVQAKNSQRRSMRFVGTLRDIRSITPGRGQKKTSNHKSGLAFDFLESDYAYAHRDFPLYYVRDESVADSVKWIVYAPVEEGLAKQAQAKIDKTPNDPRKKYVEYVDTIDRWMWDPISPAGGVKVSKLSLPNTVFLNFTKVCEAHDFRAISSRGHWSGHGKKTCTIGTASDFHDFVENLGRFRPLSHYKPADAEVLVDGKQKLPLNPTKSGDKVTTDLDDFISYLAKWVKAFASYGATPEVKVQPWTRQGEKIIRLLRAKAFQDLKAQQTITGWYSYFVPERPVGEITVIDLGPDAEFPPLLEFEIAPITSPVVVKKGMTFEFPDYGDPADMEWWHFQYQRGFRSNWGEMLKSIGWTREGLLGPVGQANFGQGGVGYSSGDLTSKVR